MSAQFDEIEKQLQSLIIKRDFENIRKNAYLSKYGYVINKKDMSNDEIIHVKNILRARPLGDDKYIFDKDTSFPVYIETQNKFYIPKFYGIDRYGKPDKIIPNYNGLEWNKEITFVGCLYESQNEPANKLIASCEQDGGGILQLGTGEGKTITTLYVLSKLCGKTLIIVNKIPLMKQWMNEIKTFLPKAKVGIIQGQKNVDINDKDIVIAMLQSLARIDYPDAIFHDIRVTVIDEIHNTASKMFSKVFTKLSSKWSIGLSATPNRSDGCEYVFKWHIGDIVFRSQTKRKGKEPIIRMIKINSNDYKEISTINKITGKTQIQYTSMLSELIEMKRRNDLILMLICDLAKLGRKILVLSDRRSHLINIKDSISKITNQFTYGLFLGSMKQKDLDKSRKCNVILATYQSFSEGVSERDLDTLILITPKKYITNQNKFTKLDNGKIEQIVGRIFRKEHVDKNPLIIDLHDNFSVYKTQGASRKIFYKQHFKKMIYEEQVVDIDIDPIEIKTIKKSEVHLEEHDLQKNLVMSNYCMLD